MSGQPYCAWCNTSGHEATAKCAEDYEIRRRANLPEDAAERQQFDSAVNRLYGGEPLRHIAATLGVWAKMAPQQGSYGKMLAIMANECAKAARLRS